MSRTIALLALALLLAAGLGLVLRPEPRDDGPMANAPAPLATRGPAPGAAPVPGTVPGAERTPDDQRLALILARPLFAPGRRPPAVAAAAAAAPPLPRIAGIILEGGRRSVIFASADGGRPLVVTEGADVNGFKVQAIEEGQVTLLGPDGPRVLRPSFDPKPPSPRAAGPAPPNLDALTSIPGLQLPLPQPGPVAR